MAFGGVIDSNTFQQEVLARMEALVEACRQHRVPMFCALQEDPQSFQVACIEAGSNHAAKLKAMVWLSEAPSLDAFMDKVITDALRNGHDSRYLRAMGVPYGEPAGASSEGPDDDAVVAE